MAGIFVYIVRVWRCDIELDAMLREEEEMAILPCMAFCYHAAQIQTKPPIPSGRLETHCWREDSCLQLDGGETDFESLEQYGKDWVGSKNRLSGLEHKARYPIFNRAQR